MTPDRRTDHRYWDAAGTQRVVTVDCQRRWGNWIAYVIRQTPRVLPNSPIGPRPFDDGDPPADGGPP